MGSWSLSWGGTAAEAGFGTATGAGFGTAAGAGAGRTYPNDGTAAGTGVEVLLRVVGQTPD